MVILSNNFLSILAKTDYTSNDINIWLPKTAIVLNISSKSLKFLYSVSNLSLRGLVCCLKFT